MDSLADKIVSSILKVSVNADAPLFILKFSKQISERESSLNYLIKQIVPVDIVIVEGFKVSDHKKVEVVNSKSEIRRLIKQGAVRVDEEQILDIHFLLDNKKHKIVKIGKRKFLKIV